MHMKETEEQKARLEQILGAWANAPAAKSARAWKA
jgi:ferritin-like metal-binding protein YciE